jgi:hypothetical protein
MRMRRLTLALAFLLTIALAASTTTPPKHPVDFDKEIEPILKAKCQPCHFPGGKMYEKRPFDRPATIIALGEKLFTRIHDEKDRALIRAFLTEQKRQGNDSGR